MDTDPEHLDTVSAIAEASQTTYVRGRWVYTDTSHETQYRIVHPMLPGSGDYSAYNLLCMSEFGPKLVLVLVSVIILCHLDHYIYKYLFFIGTELCFFLPFF